MLGGCWVLGRHMVNEPCVTENWDLVLTRCAGGRGHGDSGGSRGWLRAGERMKIERLYLLLCTHLPLPEESEAY